MLFEATLILLTTELVQTTIIYGEPYVMSLDQQQKQSKKYRWNRFIKWFCNPKILRLALTIGPTICKILSWLLEKLEQLIEVTED